MGLINSAAEVPNVEGTDGAGAVSNEDRTDPELDTDLLDDEPVDRDSAD